MQGNCKLFYIKYIKISSSWNNYDPAIQTSTLCFLKLAKCSLCECLCSKKQLKDGAYHKRLFNLVEVLSACLAINGITDFLFLQGTK